MAWRPLGWLPVAFSEVNPKACAVLSHHWPSVPNLGDMTSIRGADFYGTDIIVGGTPCQGFSTLGRRKGLDDPRSGLAHAYVDLVRTVRPRWLVWENVTGCLSSNQGQDFATFTDALGQCGYSLAYRVLDSQGFGVPQRRRRVFLVGYFGDWRPPTLALFEPDRPEGNTQTRPTQQHQAQARVWGFTACDNGTDAALEIAPTLRCGGRGGVPNVAIADSVTGIVRRLSCIELERLQGFPDNFTRVPWQSGVLHKSSRAKLLGNSIAVPVLHWLGQRIKTVDDLT